MDTGSERIVRGSQRSLCRPAVSLRGSGSSCVPASHRRRGRSAGESIAAAGGASAVSCWLADAAACVSLNGWWCRRQCKSRQRGGVHPAGNAYNPWKTRVKTGHNGHYRTLEKGGETGRNPGVFPLLAAFHCPALWPRAGLVHGSTEGLGRSPASDAALTNWCCVETQLLPAGSAASSRNTPIWRNFS